LCKGMRKDYKVIEFNLVHQQKGKVENEFAET